MNADLISFESMVAAKDSAQWAFWAMVFGGVSALATLVTTIVAIVAAFVAFKSMNAWREQEKINQLTRLKRAVFAYRAELEFLPVKHEEHRSSGFFNKMKSLRADIFHELILCGLDNNELYEYKCFEKLFISHERYFNGDESWRELFENVINFQKSIRVEL